MARHLTDEQRKAIFARAGKNQKSGRKGKQSQRGLSGTALTVLGMAGGAYLGRKIGLNSKIGGIGFKIAQFGGKIGKKIPNNKVRLNSILDNEAMGTIYGLNASPYVGAALGAAIGGYAGKYTQQSRKKQVRNLSRKTPLNKAKRKYNQLQGLAKASDRKATRKDYNRFSEQADKAYKNVYDLQDGRDYYPDDRERDFFTGGRKGPSAAYALLKEARGQKMKAKGKKIISTTKSEQRQNLKNNLDVLNKYTGTKNVEKFLNIKNGDNTRLRRRKKLEKIMGIKED